MSDFSAAVQRGAARLGLVLPKGVVRALGGAALPHEASAARRAPRLVQVSTAALLGVEAVTGVVLPRRLLRFLFVGLMGLATQTGAFILLTRLGVDKSRAWLIGVLLATAVTWALNRRFTFGASGRRRRHEALRYLVVTVIAQSFSFAVFHSFVSFAPMIPPSIDVIIGAVAATGLSYTGQRFFTFARTDDDGPAGADPKA